MVASTTLNPSERSLVESALGPSCEVHSATVVRVYKANGNSWQQQCMGAAAILTNRTLNSHFLKVVDLNRKQETFSQELYNNFDYQQPRSFFHTFEGEGYVTGFSFADENDAHEFYQKVTQCCNGAPAPPSRMSVSPQPPAGPRMSMPPPVPTPSPQSTTPPPPTNNKGTMKKEKKKGLFGSIGAMFSAKEEEDDLVISEPSNFRHASSIGWDPEKGFQINNIPPEWRRLFQSAGIKKSDLKNQKTAAFVMNLIEEHGGLEGEGAPAAPRPPPPPGAPPPPGPPPPPGGAPSAPPRPPPGGPPGSSSGDGEGRGGLLAAIRTGATLRHVDEQQQEEAATPPPPSGLAETLARAMEERRLNIREDEPDEDNDAWSDEDWE